MKMTHMNGDNFEVRFNGGAINTVKVNLYFDFPNGVIVIWMKKKRSVPNDDYVFNISTTLHISFIYVWLLVRSVSSLFALRTDRKVMEGWW